LMIDVIRASKIIDVLRRGRELLSIAVKRFLFFQGVCFA
jgi:hypothetical protein